MAAFTPAQAKAFFRMLYPVRKQAAALPGFPLAFTNFDATSGVLLTALAGTALTGTTADSFAINSGAATPTVNITCNGSTGDYTATWQVPTLAADRTITFPAVTGTLAILGANTFTAAQTIGTGASIAFTGTVTKGLDFSAVTGTQAASYAAGLILFGNNGAAASVSLTENWNPIQLVVTSAANPGSEKQMNLIYTKISTGIAQANARLKCADWNISVDHAIADAYVMQAEITNSGAGASRYLNTISCTMQLTGTGAMSGEAQALYCSVGGATGTYTGAGASELTVAKFVWSKNVAGNTAKGILEVSAAASCTATAGIRFSGEGRLTTGALQIGMGGGTGCPYVLACTSGTAYKDGAKIASITIDSATAAAGVLKIKVASTDYYIPLFALGDLTGA